MAGAPAGYDVFLSYSRADQAAADALRDRLAGEPHKLRVFIDWRALSAGRPWQPALEAALVGCRAMLVLIGPKGIGGWQHREIQLGLDRQTGVDHTATPFPVIPVLLPGLEPDDYPLGTFLALNTWVAFERTVDEPLPLQRLLTAIQGQPLDAPRDLTSLRPYRGLLAFREQDAGLFFGRERFVDELTAKVRQRSATNVVAVLGRSGSGKSSVVFAGLFPALRQEKGAGQQAIWQILDLRPGAEPLHALIETFDPPDEGLTRAKRLASVNADVELLRQRKLTLAQLVRDRLKDDPGTTRLLLYVDQWEELYTQAQPREPKTDEDKARAVDARLYVDLLLDAAAKSPCTLVLSVRSDFYPDLQTHDRLRAAVQDCQVSLGPMTKVELTAAIDGPAKALGGSVEPELTKKLLRDIGLDPANLGTDHYDIGKLPLLEYALEQAWAKANDGRLGLAHYAGLEQALEERANEIYDRLGPDQKDFAKRLFVSLVTPGEGREDTRARIVLESDSDLLLVAEAFAANNARLVVTGDESGARVVEVSHEALIRHWERLRGWIEINRANLRTRSDLAWDRVEWLKNIRRADLLIPSGLRLESAKRLLEEPGDVEIDDLLDYIQESIDADLSSQEAARASQRAQYERDLAAAHKIGEEQRRRAQVEAKAADDLRRQADKDKRRASFARQQIRLFGIVACIAVAFGVYRQYLYSLVQPNSDEIAASSIWRRLIFDSEQKPVSDETLDVLWQLTSGTDMQRDSFLYQLSKNSNGEILKLVAAPLLISRAFGLTNTDTDIERLIGPLLREILGSSNPYLLERSSEALQILGPRLRPQQARAALGPVIDAIRQTTDLDQLQALARAIQTLGPKLAPEQAQAALGPVRDAIRQNTDLPALQALTQAIQTLGPRLRPQQAQATLGPVRDAIRWPTDPFQLRAPAHAIQTIGPKLPPEQAQAALGQFLDAIRHTTNPYQLQAPAHAVQTLLAKLAPEQAQAALGPILDAIRHTTDEFQRQVLAHAIQTIGPKLPPEQAQAALGPILDAIRQTFIPEVAQALALAIQSLGPRLTPEQAQAALGKFLDAIRQTTGPYYQPRALAQAVQTLVLKLAPEQDQAALGKFLDAIRQTTDPDQLQALALVLQTLGPKLAPEHANRVIEISRSELAAADEPVVATEFARAIALTQPVDPAMPQPYVATVVELLKWPTTALPGATEALLEVLHDRVPEAPGKEAGLDATVQWVAATFPEIDLDRPPTPPASVTTAGAW